MKRIISYISNFLLAQIVLQLCGLICVKYALFIYTCALLPTYIEETILLEKSLFFQEN